MLPTDPELVCPCGSGKPYSQCCSPFHSGTAHAPTAEALMRSRFSAFALGAVDYLIDTLAVERRSHNEAQLLAQELRQTNWLRLEIVDTVDGNETDSVGVVEFNAFFSSPQGEGCLHERSNFRRDNGRWVYVDGDVEVI